MGMIFSFSSWLKSLNWVQRSFFLRPLMRRLFFLTLGPLYRKGVSKNIGGSGNFLMSSEFFFSDFVKWGEGHNNGFNKMLTLAKGKSVVFDIGAHIGLCAMPLSRELSKDGRCYAFEPSGCNRKYLKNHLEMNMIGNVSVIPHLVGNKCVDSITFFENSKSSGMNSICPSRKNHGKGYLPTSKRQITIDSFVNENNCVPGFIKIDVEGAEINVLLGAMETLKKYRPPIILSVHPKHLVLLGHSVCELKKVISDLNYQVFNIDESLAKGELEFKEYYLR